MSNFLGVKWKSSDSDNKPKLDALRDAMSIFVCVSVNFCAPSSPAIKTSVK